MKSRKIMTYTGKGLDFWSPDRKSICIRDVAHALALTNRYSGHTFEPYSVAEHCVRASYLDVGNPLINLLHDAAEAYIGDVASPQKQCLHFMVGPSDGFFSFRDVESKLLRAIGDSLGICNLNTSVKHECIKTADLIMLATEVRDLMHSNSKDYFAPWLGKIEPLPERIIPWDWAEAEDKYLHRFSELVEEL